jgi:hypothetical protein
MACANGTLSANGVNIAKKNGCWSEVTVRFDGEGYQRNEVTLRIK